MQTTLSLCMIVKDEAENLPGCLGSVAGVVDEVVVVDTGSVDATMDVARSHGAKVSRAEWKGSFSLARNAALDQATGDWILVMDADERLDARDKTRLRMLLESAGPDSRSGAGPGGGRDAGRDAGPPSGAESRVDGFLLRVVNHLGPSDESGAEVHLGLRLFRRRPELRYEGTVHEQPPVPRPRITDIRLHHYGYLPEVYAGRGKPERNEHLLREALESRPEDPFLLYSLAVLQYSVGEHEACRETMTRAISVMEPSRHYHSRALKVLAMAEGKTLGPGQAMKTLTRALASYPDFTDLYYLRASFRRDVGDYAGAVGDVCECLERGEAPIKYDSHTGVGGRLAVSLLGELLREYPGSRLRVFRALLEAATRAAVSGDALAAEAAFRLGADEARAMSGRLKGPVAGAAGRLLASYVEYLKALSVFELEQGVKRAPWCEKLGRAWRAGEGGLPLGPPPLPAPPGTGELAVGVASTRPPENLETEPPGRVPTISLCMIVRDEEEALSRCLDSVKDCVDEMIVVDTGSSDSTRAVALAHGARVLDFAWTGDFSEARNVGLEQAKGDWILCLDADEEFGPDQAAVLRAVVASNPGAEGFLVRVIDYLGDYPGLDQAGSLGFRLFRNRPEHRYSRALHEQMTPITYARDGRPTVLVAPLVVYHYGYLVPVDRAKNRVARNTSLAEREASERADPYAHFNLAVEYLKVGRYEEALKHYQETIDKADRRLVYAAEARLRAAITLAALGAQEDAILELQAAEKEYPAYTDLPYLRGEMLMATGRPVEAAIAFLRCLKLGEASPDFPTLLGVGTFRAATCLGEVYEALGSPRAALGCYARALGLEPRFVPAYLGRARCLVDLYGDAARDRFEAEVAPPGTSDLKTNLLLGYAWLSAYRPDWALPYLVRAAGEAESFDAGAAPSGGAKAELEGAKAELEGAKAELEGAKAELEGAKAKAESLLGLALFLSRRDEDAVRHLALGERETSMSAFFLALLGSSRVEEARAYLATRERTLKTVLLEHVARTYTAGPAGSLEEVYRESPQTYVAAAREIVTLAAARKDARLLEAALELMRPIEDLGPWLEIGKMYDRVGYRAMAVAELKDCLEKGAVDPVAAALLGCHLASAGEGPEGERWLRRALKWNPTTWQAWLGLWESLRHRYAEVAREALTIMPRNVEVKRACRRAQAWK